MSTTTMLVPMEMSALMINDQVLTKPFRRWRANYLSLDDYLSPIPGAFDGEMSSNFNSDPSNKGIYLKWDVPKALRQGVTNRQTGAPVFPMLPNRWLVVRFYGDPSARKAKAWVIESDCPNTTDNYGSTDSTLYVIDPTVIDAWLTSSSSARSSIAQTLLNGATKADTDTIYTNLLGKPFDLTGWTEQGIDKLFLQAVAPGNTEFIAYQPNVGNLYSFHDRVQDEADVSENMALSYMVTGWYSNEDEDPLSQWQTAGGTDPYNELLSQFQWTVADGGTDQATASQYHGLIYDLVWQNSALPSEQIQEVSDLHVAVGNNAVDAFQNMIEQQLEDQAENDADLATLLEDNPDVSKMLEAFQYDMLYMLDQPNGDAMLENRIRQEWYGPKGGGFRWVVTDKEDMDPTSEGGVSAAELEKENTWLTQLNQDQADLDSLQKQLKAQQRNLYGMWWKWQRWQTYPSFAKPSSTITDQQFEDALDPSKSASLPAQIIALNSSVSSQAAKVPIPNYATSGTTPEEAFQSGIDTFASAKETSGVLSSTRMLKALNEGHFWYPNDPVVLVTGARNTQTMLSDSLLQVRLDSQLVTAFTDGNFGTVSASNLDAYTGLLDFSALASSSVISGLFLEAVLLDPVNATAFAALLSGTTAADVEAVMKTFAAANYTGILPQLKMEDWSQPWNPLYFEWKVEYYPIDHTDEGGNMNWSFDGTDYNYVGAIPSSPTGFEVSGRSILTSQVTSIFEKRLQEYIDSHSSDPVWQSISAQLTTDNWDFLAQSFTNFGRSLSTLEEGSNRLPETITVNTSTVDVASYVNGQTEVLPNIPANPQDQKFQGVRQGQFFVKEVIIYDEFGQVLNVVETADTGLKSYNNFHPILGPELLPDQFILPTNTWRLIQLPPRVLQHSRMNFRLVDALTPTKYVDIDGTANPVGGWLLPNHLENGISIYDPNGQSLGVVRLLVDTTGTKRIGWQAPPHSSIASLVDVRTAAPLVGNWYDALASKGPDALASFLSVIDETLWTVDPMGGRSDQNLSVLIGRPLALTRAVIDFELDGPPIMDQSWDATFATAPPAFTEFDYDIRLGEQELRQDGLIGYFLNEDYDSFHNVHTPEGTTNDYLSEIAPGNYFSLRFDGQTKADVIMLVDPRAAVHALTGLFPVSSLTIPDRFVSPVLSNFEVSFHIGSLVTEVQSNPDTEQVAAVPFAIGIPTPAEQNGTWSWWEEEYHDGGASSWTEMGLVQEDQTAKISQLAKTLRDGFLQLDINLEDNS